MSIFWDKKVRDWMSDIIGISLEMFSEMVGEDSSEEKRAWAKEQVMRNVEELYNKQENVNERE